MSRRKRVKFYKVPTSEATDQVRHASFTLSSEKTSVQNSFVMLSRPTPVPDINRNPPQDPLSHSLHNDESNEPQVSPQ
jgi:hypothetical protein